MPSRLLPPPSHLMCDFAEYTDRVFVAGEVAALPVDRRGEMLEQGKVALIHNRRPVFSWAMGATSTHSQQRQVYQAAFRLVLSATAEAVAQGEGDLWDSGRVDGGASLARYAGAALQSDTVYYWSVMVWDDAGGESPFAPVRAFLTASELQEYRSPRYPLVQCRQQPALSRRVDGKTTFFDFGRAAAARPKLTVRTRAEGVRLRVHIGEALDGAGRLDRTPGANVRYHCSDVFLVAGEYDYAVTLERHDKSERPWTSSMPPYVGEVFPFRYCEVEEVASGYEPVELVEVSRQVVHHLFDDGAAFFRSSDSVLNDVWDLCKYTAKATTYTGLYIDGDRERTPYEADSYINQLCHYSVDREFTMARATLEFLIYEACWPTEWLLMAVQLAWWDYYHTGDTSLVEHYYDELKHKALTALIDEHGFISTRTGKVTDELYEAVHLDKDRFPFSFRDNVDYPFPGILGIPEDARGEIDGFVYADYNTVINAYFYRTLLMMAELGDAIGRPDEKAFYEEKAATVRGNFQRYFFMEDAGIYRDGIGTDHSSLHANMFPLCFGLVPDEHIASVMAHIRSRGMACSVYGAQFLLDAVYRAGDGAYGLELMTATHDRSWAHMIYDIGSTISLEAWDVRYKPNLDWNHPWGAAPANIIPRQLMGVEPLAPGFAKMRIKPQPGSLEWAEGRVPTIRGEVALRIDQEPGKSFRLTVSIPPNSETELWLPLWESGLTVSRDGTSVSIREKVSAGDALFAVVENACSGSYQVVR